jgi:hypothetical protein
LIQVECTRIEDVEVTRGSQLIRSITLQQILARFLPLQLGQKPKTPIPLTPNYRCFSIYPIFLTHLTRQNRFVRPEDMSKDRTNEFLAICRSMGTNAMAGKGAGRNRQRSQIAARCRAVGKDITNTWDKLGRLTQLCKSTTLFNDKPVEIQELTYIIKQDMDQMR